MEFAKATFHEIFKAPVGSYINEKGETVTGKLPRSRATNPFSLLGLPSARNLVFFFVGWMAWTAAEFDFHSIGLALTRLSDHYNMHSAKVSTAITLTLLLRPVGGMVFGFAGDLYGRKWPLIINLAILALLQLLSVFCDTFPDFVAVRALFGIAMGGIWGNAAAMCLENIPIEARGMFSGIFQQGDAIGYLASALFNLYVVPDFESTWKLLFYIGGGFTFIIAILRMVVGESKQFVDQAERARQNPELQLSGSRKIRAFKSDIIYMVKEFWGRSLYAVVLMTFFNTLTHCAEDFAPTIIEKQKGFTADQASRAAIIASGGAILGSIFGGWWSQSFGRRATIMVMCLIGTCFVPLWVIPTSLSALTAGAFIIQFCVQAAWGVIPIYLNEISPPQFRSTFPGVSYQIGNMVSAGMAEVAAAICQHWHIDVTLNGVTTKIQNYRGTETLFTVLILVTVLQVASLGFEQANSHFELASVAGTMDADVDKKLGMMEEAEDSKGNVATKQDVMKRDIAETEAIRTEKL